MAFTIYNLAFHPGYLLDLVRKSLETDRFSKMLGAFPEFLSERKKRTTSEGYPQFSKRATGKLPFHLT